MKICIDDGSTAIKMQWDDGKAFQRFVSLNSFRHGSTPSLGGTKADNYVCSGDTYTFDPTATGISTTEIGYQYADVNAVAVHHALHNSGIPPQAVDIIVTLPLAEFYTADFEPNLANINRKIDNLKQPVEALKRQPFTFNTVEVVPESIPAAFHALASLTPLQSLLVVDLGGTTLDICHLAEKGARIVQAHGEPQLGVSLMTNEVRDWMAANGTQPSPVTLDWVVRNRAHLESLEDVMVHDGYGAQLHAVIGKAQQKLAQRVVAAVSKFKGFTNVLIVGGGADLVGEALQRHLEFSDKRFSIADDAQFALVDGIYWMTK